MIRLLAVITVAFILQTSLARHPFHFDKYFSKSENDNAKIWAVLVAGSKGWDNYRHQADVCHAYQTLIDHGVPAENIITFAYDDIAKNTQNPYPGKIFNEPYGADVYANCALDYTSTYVTPENFLAVLKGNSSGVKGGTGRVVESTSDDNIFVFFSDHGASGFISFPSTILTAKVLNTALEAMNTAKSFNKLVFYLEACESGSMFSGILKTNVNVYAITAANETESSWGCYCDNEMYLPCLGDLFSVSWMDDSDTQDLTTETLNVQYNTVKTKTSKSNVKQYGDLTIAENYVAAFQGWTKKSNGVPKIKHSISAWPVRDISLMTLKKKAAKAEKYSIKKKMQSKVDEAEMKREYLENFMRDFVESLVQDSSMQKSILNKHPREITELECHDKIINAFHKSCFNFNLNPYAMKYGYVLTNLCEHGVSEANILAKIYQKCTKILIGNIH